MKDCKRWTKDEMARLRELVNESTPVSRLVDQFPGRTPCALYRKIGEMKLRKFIARGRLPYRDGEVLELLNTRGPMFATDIAKEFGVGISGVRELLLRMHAAKRIHLKERVLVGRSNRAYLWAAGTGIDAPPVTKNPARPRAKKVVVAVEKPRTVVHVHRDPLVAAFFGAAA